MISPQGGFMPKQLRAKFIIPTAALLACIAAIFFFLYLYPADMRYDFKQLAQGNHELIFLSMYPIDNYEAADFERRYAMETLITSHDIPNLFTLKNYLKKADESGRVSLVYLGILPEQVDSEKLAALLLEYPNIEFQILMPYASMDYWLSLSDTQCDRLLQTYRDFIPPLLGHENISLYSYVGSEWLLCNPANYKDSFLVTREISKFLMLHADPKLDYLITPNTQPSPTASVDALAALIAGNRNTPTAYPDLSAWNIVFFGDSVIGNYTDSTSVPAVTDALTGAVVYNMGYGGTCMAKAADNDKSSLFDIVTAFTEGNSALLPSGSQCHRGMEQYFTDSPWGNHCFVINYGLNDYFMGLPISSDDPYDIYTFKGAARASIQALREAYPDAQILLNTPNFTVLFENGTEPHSSHVLADYVNALKEVATELNVDLLDNYNELGIHEENEEMYLSDGCHPNERGRFLIGQRIAWKLGEKLLK